MSAKTEHAWDIYMEGYGCLFGKAEYNVQDLITAYKNLCEVPKDHEP